MNSLEITSVFTETLDGTGYLLWNCSERHQVIGRHGQTRRHGLCEKWQKTANRTGPEQRSNVMVERQRHSETLAVERKQPRRDGEGRSIGSDGHDDWGTQPLGQLSLGLSGAYAHAAMQLV